MRGDFREGSAAVGFVSWNREAWGWRCVWGTAIEDRSEGFGVGEGMVDAGPIAVLEVVGATVEHIVVGAGGHEFEIAIGDLEELWFVFGEQDVSGMAAVAGAASPPAPLVVTGAPGVVPRAIREHELHVGPEGSDGLVEDGLIVGQESVLGQGGERFFYVVAEIDGTAFLRGDGGLWMALAEEEVVGCEVIKGGVRESVSAVGVVMITEDLGADGKAVR